jgi:dynein heavy chain
MGILRMWTHECMRIFYDRLIFDVDRELFMSFMKTAFREFDAKEELLLEEPLLYTSFVSACEGHEKAYMPIKDMAHLKGVLETKLAEYNE